MRAVPCVSGKGPGRRGSHKDSAQHNSINQRRPFEAISPRLMSVHLQIRSDTIVGFHDATFIFPPSDKIRLARAGPRPRGAPSARSPMSLLASLRSLGSHLRCAGGPLSLRAGMGQALGPAAAQMFVRGMKVRSAIKKRCESMLRTRRVSG